MALQPVYEIALRTVGEEPFVGPHPFATRQLHLERSAPDFAAQLVHGQASFLLQFAQGGLLERLAVFNGTTWRGPVAASGQRVGGMDEFEKQNASRLIQQKHPRRRTHTHAIS
ncbi:hypothetical protein GCM10010836_38120 [Aminobacter aminovorans]